MHDTRNLIENYYTAFNRGDWEAMLGLLDEEVVHDLNQAASERGREASSAFLARMARCYSEQLRNVVVMSSADCARAAAEYVVNGSYKLADEGLPRARGQTNVLPDGAFFDIRDGTSCA